MYSIKCKDCLAEYIGETRNELRKIITEHTNTLKTRHGCNGHAATLASTMAQNVDGRYWTEDEHF